MKSRSRLLLPLLVLTALPAASQPVPVTPAVLMSPQQQGFNSFPVLTPAPDGTFLVSWTRQEDGKIGVVARRFDGAAAAGGMVPVSQSEVTNIFEASAAAMHASGTSLFVWQALGTPRLLGRVFDPSGAPRGPELEIYSNPNGSFFQELQPAATATKDGFVVVWEDQIRECETGIFARRFDAEGAPLGAELRLDAGTSPFYRNPAVAAVSDGGFVAVWEAETPDTFRLQLNGRRFDAAGAPLGDEFRIDSPPEHSPADAAVAGGADGGFVVVWKGSFGFEGIFGRRFGPGGAPLGAKFRIDTTRVGFQAQPKVAFLQGGGFVVVWSQSFTPDVSARGRIFDAGGRPRGPEFRVGLAGLNATGTMVSTGPGGDFTAAWSAFNEPSRQTVGIYVQHFRIPPPGADACVVVDDHLACNTLRTAGGPLLTVPLALQPGDALLLGNLDGDLHDDPCLYRAGIFRCDLDHLAEPSLFVAIAFGGAPGDLPLLGDVNGDGRDDACLRRGRRFACDTAHNGGKGEVQILFGLKSDLPSLGDVDGDGDDEPCLYRRNQFLCDTVHDGGGAEVTVSFGQAGDIPLLADADADGDDDFCVFRGDRFLCDTAHDGGSAELEILAPAGAMPLLGNVDGF